MKHKTIKEMLEYASIMYPDNISFYEKENKEYKGITYKQLYEDVMALGNALIEKGLKDKNIAVIGKNSYEWAVAYLASVCGLGTVVPLDKQLTKEEIENSLRRLEIGTIIYSKEESKIIDTEKYNTICMQTEMKDLIEEGKTLNNNYEKIKVNEKDLASYLFTSGTTSESKIVMLTNENIMYNINNVDQFLNVNEKDKFFSILPMHHTFECTCGFLTPLNYGASIIHVDSLKNIQRDMQKMKPTMIIGVPRITDLFDKKITNEIEKKGKTKLVKYAKYVTNTVPPLKKKIFKDIHESFGGELKTILVGGAPANKDVLKRLREYGFTVLQGYGLTECAPLVAGNQINKFNDEAAGIPLRGTDVKIVNANEEGVGEIAVKGKNVMLGYYDNEKATNEAIKEDGYFYTGDLGIIDKKGFIIIKGRSKNVIITSNGKNVYPEELENIIGQNESIQQAIVSCKKDAKGNDVITVEIVLVDKLLQRFMENEKFKEEIVQIINNYIKEINQKIAEYKRIQKVELKDQPFEETSTQKVKRYKK